MDEATKARTRRLATDLGAREPAPQASADGDRRPAPDQRKTLSKVCRDPDRKARTFVWRQFSGLLILPQNRKRSTMVQTTEIPLPPAEFVDRIGGGDFNLIGTHLFDVIVRHAQAKPSARILDIGSGCGRVAVPFTRHLTTGAYDGIEIVPEMVNWCKANITSRYPNFRFHHADLSNTAYRPSEGASAEHYTFPFGDQTFDLVIATSLFTHLLPPSAVQYAREVKRVLAPKGRAFLTFYLLNDTTERRRSEPHVLKFGRRLGNYAIGDQGAPETVVGFEETYARELLSQAGLTVDVISFGQWSMNNGWTYQDVVMVS